MEENMENVVWIIDLLLKWYFGKGDLEPKAWEDTSIPNNLLLIPFILKINENLEEQTDELLSPPPLVFTVHETLNIPVEL